MKLVLRHVRLGWMGLGLWMASIGSTNHMSLAQESQDRPPVRTKQEEAGNAAAFEEHFTGNSLRLELFQGGDAKQSWITLHQVRVESEWPGNRKNLIYPFPYGKYRVQVFAEDSKQLLYSHGFDTLFAEFATTTPAIEGKTRTFPISVRVPEPKSGVKVQIDHRLANNDWQSVFEYTYNPDDYSILREKMFGRDEVIPLAEVGSPSESLDIVFLSEGYTAERREAFLADANRMFQFLMEQVPFRDYRDKINATCIFRASHEAGTDEPRQHRFKNTALHSSFNALDTDRYLLVEDGHAIHRMASQAAYDCPVVLVDSRRYGGGAICLDNCVTTAHHQLSPQVFVHEFGHALAYLADEYVGAVSYNEIYPEGVEPVEPNLTRTLDREKLKWRHLLTPDIPLPTSPNYEVEGSSRLVGAYEGGGYVKERIYRPQRDCCMGSGGFHHGFCVVCDEAIRKMLDYYTRK